MRTAFITGASSDIGLSLCRQYLSAGHSVIGHYRTQRPEIDALQKDWPNFQPFQFDFSDITGFEREIAEHPDRFTAADILINLAAEVRPARFENLSVDGILRTLSTNLLPGLLLMRVMGPAMAKRGWGRVVHGSSIGVKFGGGADSFSYALSKHALEFIPSICRDWAAKNVLVNVLRVGVTDTSSHAIFPEKDLNKRVSLIPISRMATPEEIANALFWLASEKNTYITGQIINVSGGE